MLQRRGDNEQFSSLPSLRPLDHPRHSLITTDRPDSSQLVDLHIYVVPKTVWKDGQRLAQNEAMDDAVSAGFVRVPPHMSIRELRRTIEAQCGKESYFPRDFIYLRSVGRCMTKVKTKQEDELRVKNYRPPQTFAPEIYLLEGRQEDYLQNEVASPEPSSPCEICGTHDGHRADHEKQRPRRNGKRADRHDDPTEYDRQRYPSYDPDESPSRLSQTYRRPVRATKQYPPLTSMDNGFARKQPPAERPNYNRPGQNGYDPEESTAVFSDVRSTPSSNLPKLREEQERLRRRQAELERQRRAAEEKRTRSQRSDGDPSRSDADDDHGRRNQPSRRAARDPPGHQSRPSYPDPKKAPPRVDRSRRMDDDDDDDRKPPGRSQPPYNSSRRQTYPMPHALAPKPENPKPGVNPKRTRAPVNSGEYERTRNEIAPLPPERREFLGWQPTPIAPANERQGEDATPVHISIRTGASPVPSVLSINATLRPLDQESFRQHNQQSASGDSLTRPFTQSTSAFAPDEIDTERRNADQKRRQQMEDELNKKKEEPRRRDPLKGVKEDPEALRVRYQEIRNRRLDLERAREEVIRHLKNIHNRITLRRKEARDMWKKKYYNEKKKHVPLEERINALRSEVDQSQKKTLQTMEAEAKYAAQMGYGKEAAAGNSIAHITRINYEIADIRHQLEQAKLKLTTDVKLRNQAENECRSLKHELTQAKKNLNDIKSRAGP